jgi:hypothetical protein
MIQANAGPSLISFDEDEGDEVDTSQEPIRILTDYNMGNRTLVATFPLKAFFARSEIANERTVKEKPGYRLTEEEIAQRKLYPDHARKLALYILKALFYVVNLMKEIKPPKFYEMVDTLHIQSFHYLGPLVANIRDVSGLRIGKDRMGIPTAFLGLNHTLWVVDGQHRREAIHIVLEFLKETVESRRYKRNSLYPSALNQQVSDEEFEVWELLRNAMLRCNIAVEILLGLNAEQERQVFYDLNNLGKPIDKNLALTYDTANPVNLFCDELEQMGIGKPQGMSRTDLVAINAILLLNKTGIKGADTQKVEGKKTYANQVWREIMRIPGFAEGDGQKTVAVQSVVLKAIAKVAYSLKWNKKTWNEQDYKTLVEGIHNGKLDLTSTNPMWRWYHMNEEERNAPELAGLKDYVPPVSQVKRDIGKHSPDGVFRFGITHNDIFPIIGDMIRWKLGITKRDHRTRASVIDLL